MGGEIGFVVDGVGSRREGDCGLAVDGLAVDGMRAPGFGAGRYAGSVFVGGALIVGGCDDGGLLDDGSTVGGLTVGGFTVGGFTVGGPDIDTDIEGCVVGDNVDVSGATSTLGDDGAERPGKTVGG